MCQHFSTITPTYTIHFPADFYVRDLEAKLDAHRAREASLAEEMDRARLLVQGLQRENAVLLDREREMVAVQEQLHERAFPRSKASRFPLGSENIL